MENRKLRTIFGQLAANCKSAAGERLLSQFIDEYTDVLAAKIRYHLPGRDDLVEEALFEVFMAVWREGPKLAFIERPAGWLIQVGRNKAISQSRKESKHGFGQAKLLDDYCDLADPRPLFDEMVYRDYLGTIEAGALLLPEQQRKVYIMRHFDDLRVVTIANLLKIEKTTVKRHLRLARESLRKRQAHIWKEGLE